MDATITTQHVHRTPRHPGSTADELVLKLLTEDPMNPALHEKAGRKKYAQKRFNEAIASFEAAKLIDPSQMHWMNYYIAECHFELKQIDEAIQLLRDSLLLEDEGNTAAVTLLARAYAYNHQPVMAYDVLKEILHYQAENYAVHEIVGMAHYYRREYEQALACFTRAIELNGNIPRLYRQAARVLRRMKQLDEALHKALQARDHDPNDADTHRLLWSIHRALGNHQKAERHRFLSRQLRKLSK